MADSSRAVIPRAQWASALASIAEAVIPADSDRAAELTADAERIAQSLSGPGSKATTLARIAEAWPPRTGLDV